jgi:hypothetical protein
VLLLLRGAIYKPPASTASVSVFGSSAAAGAICHASTFDIVAEVPLAQRKLLATRLLLYCVSCVCVRYHVRASPRRGAADPVDRADHAHPAGQVDQPDQADHTRATAETVSVDAERAALGSVVRAIGKQLGFAPSVVFQLAVEELRLRGDVEQTAVLFGVCAHPQATEAERRYADAAVLSQACAQLAKVSALLLPSSVYSHCAHASRFIAESVSQQSSSLFHLTKQLQLRLDGRWRLSV